MTQVMKHFQKPWQVMVSVCLNRMNLISRTLTDIEQRYATFQEDQEIRLSVYNDYEYKKLKLEEIKRDNSDIYEDSISDASRQLASMQDEMDMWIGDSKRITLASTNTPYDQDKTSLQRQLKDVLHFVIKDCTLLNEDTTMYPYDIILPNETLRTASERILKSNGITLNTLFLSNTPVGCLKIRYKEDEERGKEFQGAKVFITKAQLQPSPTSPFFHKETNLDILNNTNSPQWLTETEFQQTSNDEYFKRIVRYV